MINSLAIDYRPIKQLEEFVHNHEIDILHAHSSGAHSFALKLKKRLPHLKLVVHRRVAFKKRHFNFSQKKYLSPLIDAYIAISEAVRENLIDRGVSSNKVYTIPSAVQIEQFQLHSKAENHHFNLFELSKAGYDLPNNTLLIGTASAFTKEKGLTHFVSAIENLQKIKNLPRYAVLMAGTGELFDAIKKELAQKNLNIPFLLLGYKEDIATYLSGLDIFVMPSLYEGLGSVALEALAAECCVVSSDAGGLKEFIIEHETGLIYPVSNIEKLTQQLQLALTDETLRKRLAKNGLSLVEKNIA